MRLEAARLTLRLNRFELIAFGAGLGGLVIATLAASAYVASLTPGPECTQAAAFTPVECEVAFQAFSNAQQAFGGLLLAPLLLVTYAIGLFLGVPIIARELERGTVRLAWSLAPARWRWFVARLVPVLVVLVVLTFAAGVAADQFFAASTPGGDSARSFDGYGARGGLLASRALFIFAIAVATGSIIGRALPAIIVAALVATIGLFGLTQGHQEILKREAVAVPVDTNEDFGGYGRGDLYFDQKFVLQDGSMVGWEYFGDSNQPFDEFGNSLYPMVSMVVPGERYRFVEAREALALGVASFGALLLAAGVVTRRRPG